MRNAGLDEAQAEIMKVKKENEKIGLKLNIQKTNFMAALTICTDLGTQNYSLSLFPLFPHLFQ